jgi:hypothetical protein
MVEARVDWIEAIGYLGTALTISASAMSTMIPLRIISLCASCAVITYGILIGSMPVVLTEAIQIPFNAYRLWQMMRLVRDVETAADGNLSLEWLRPFGSQRPFGIGEVVFRKGEEAGEMYYVESGAFRIPEVGIEVRKGGIVGELAGLHRGRQRALRVVFRREAALLPEPGIRILLPQAHQRAAVPERAEQDLTAVLGGGK